MCPIDKKKPTCNLYLNKIVYYFSVMKVAFLLADNSLILYDIDEQGDFSALHFILYFTSNDHLIFYVCKCHLIIVNINPPPPPTPIDDSVTIIS